jgi:uncharacterized protein YkwD
MQEKTLMNVPNRWTTTLTALAAALALAACGGGSSNSSVTPAAPAAPAAAVVVSPPQPGEPASVGNTAIDGRNWINYRRGQVGMAAMSPNALIDRAAQAHSEYQKANNEVTHDEVAGKSGFTGADLLQRLNAASFNFAANANYAYGEVISATTNNSGFYMAEELITAIYHRFVIFEPQFKEIGTGAATTTRSYTYFTADFAANNGYGPGIGRGQIMTWPYNGQTAVTPNFFSDFEAPDPVPDRNEVGYPVSVHGDISGLLAVQSFTIRPRGGADLEVRLLKHDTDKETPASAAAIVPLAVLKAATTYDVSFTGTADGVAVVRNWSFTTK